jgi:hypothetical protein
MAGQDRSNQYLRRVRSNAADGILTTDYANDYIARGYGFALEENFSISSGSTLYLLIDYSTYTDFSISSTDNIAEARVGVVFVLPPRMATTAGPVQVNVYRGGDYSGGNATLYSKRNTLSDIDPQITMTEGASGTDKGTLVLSYLIGSSSTNQDSGGGVKEGIVPFIRDNTGQTLVEIVNESGDDITFSYGQTFYEI